MRRSCSSCSRTGRTKMGDTEPPVAAYPSIIRPAVRAWECHNSAVARLLLIDDDPAVSLTLSRMLEFRGHYVTRVESAEAGLSVAIGTPPDAVILDMKMPQMGGLEFLRRLRAVAGLEQLPVGVITGDYFLGEGVLQELSQLRASVRYKPIRMEDLAALTDQLLATAT
jgi:CheY-like chemotaxis protein